MTKSTQTVASDLPPENENFSTRVENSEHGLYLNAEGKGVIHSSDETFARAFIREVNNDLNDVKHSFFKIGFRLCEADEFEYYKELGYQNIAELAEAEFGFKSSTTYNLMRVYALAHDRENRMCIAENYDKYSYSQLRELVYLKHDIDRAKRLVRPSDSVREIKRFVANWNKSDLRFDCGYLSDVKTVEDYLNACDEKQAEKQQPANVHAGQLPGQMAIDEVPQEEEFSTRVENSEKSERSDFSEQSEAAEDPSALMSDDQRVVYFFIKYFNGNACGISKLKFLINEAYAKGPLMSEFKQAVKEIYNLVQFSTIINGHIFSNGEVGLTIHRTNGMKIILAWGVVAGRISRLIQAGNYLTDKEQVEYLQWKAEEDRIASESERSDFSEQSEDDEEPEEDFDTFNNENVIDFEPEAENEPVHRTNREFLSTLSDEQFVSELCLKILNAFPMNGKSAAFMSTVKSKLVEWLQKPHEGVGNE